MSRTEGQDGSGEVVPGLAAAQRALEALVPPLRFALGDAARAERLKGFAELVRTAVARARSFGAPDTPALARLEVEAEAFEALPSDGRRAALARVAADLASLIPVPAELRDIARAARAGAIGKGRGGSATAKATAASRATPASTASTSSTSSAKPTPGGDPPSPPARRSSERTPMPRSEAGGEGRGEGGRVERGRDRSGRPLTLALSPAEAGERGRNPTPIPTSTPTRVDGPASRTHGTSITDVPLPPPPTPIEDAPRYPGEGFRRPRLADADCIRSALRVPRDAVERLSGPVTVRFAVGRDGAVSRIEVLGGVSDRRVTDGIAAAVRGCPFVPGADAQGEPTALWVTLPVRFAGQ